MAISQKEARWANGAEGTRERLRPTVTPGLPTEPSRPALWGRRVLVTVLLLVLAAGASGLLGVRTGEVAAGGDGGLDVRLDYATSTRPGLATPWTLTVTRPGGFDEPIEIATSASYLRAFDTNTVSPQPESETARSDTVVWTFSPPPGDTFEVSLDASWEPGVQWRRRGTTTVRSGTAEAEVRYTTWVLP